MYFFLGCRKVPVMVKSSDDVVLSATNFVSERLCPIFQVSNVTGENLELLKMFLNLLTTRMTGLDNLPAEFQIDDTYSVPGNFGFGYFFDIFSFEIYFTFRHNS